MTEILGVDRPDLWWLVLLALPLIGVSWSSRRGLSRGRWWTTLLLRLTLLLGVVAALCEVTWRRAVDDLAVVFVVDQSASLGSEGLAATGEVDLLAPAIATQGDAGNPSRIADASYSCGRPPLVIRYSSESI